MAMHNIQGACISRPDLFFSEKPEEIQAAKSLCRGCGPSQHTACFRVALGSDIIALRNGVTPGFGVYAGMSPEERAPYVQRWSEQHPAEPAEPKDPNCNSPKTPREYHLWTPEMLERLADGVRRGLTQKAIAEQVGNGVTEEGVRKRIRRERDAGNL